MFTNIEINAKNDNWNLKAESIQCPTAFNWLFSFGSVSPQQYKYTN